MPAPSAPPSPRLAVAILAGALLALPFPAAASFGGRLELGFGFTLVAGMVIAVPVGLLCLAAEWAGARHRPPLWLGLAATAGVLYCFVRGWSGGTNGEPGYLILPVPPLMSLALVTLVRPRRQRVVAVWAGAALAAGMVLWRLIATAESSRNSELMGGMTGGVMMTMLLWYCGHFLGRGQADGQAPAPSAAMAETPTPPASADPPATAPSLRPLLDRVSEVVATRAFPGLAWWVAGAAFWYAGVGLLTALGVQGPYADMINLELRVADLMGWRTPDPGPHALRGWFVHGLGWSALAGCGAWGAAATAGRFDPGRLAPLRLAGLVAGIALLLLAVAGFLPPVF